MTTGIKKIFSYIFAFLCVFATFLMCLYWGYKFSLDEDLSAITYRKFYERETDDYPTASFCLQDPFLRTRLDHYGINNSLYLQYLKGDYMSEEMLKINYTHVTIDISDHIKGYRVYFRNGSIIRFDSGLNMKEKQALFNTSFNGFNGIYLIFWKCFALNIPRVQDVMVFRILLSNSIFPNGYRPTYFGFKVVYHLSQQFILAGESKKW